MKKPNPRKRKTGSICCVYNYKVHLCFFSIEGSEDIRFFASPYPAVTANRSGP